MATKSENALGAFLKDRRAKLDPSAFGFPLAGRRTPGLRREEVALRAAVSVIWYTWLEQGRGGAPSDDALDRIADALLLTDAEREYLFLLALGRPPRVRYREAEGVTPRVQRLLDSLELSPAYVKTPTWDVVAWNRAASEVLTDYGTIAPEQRNILRLFFRGPHIRAKLPDWEGVARFKVAAFRGDAARAGAGTTSQALVDDLCRLSPDFDAMWHDNDVRSTYGERAQHTRHPRAGLIALEYSSFAIDGRPDLSLVTYTPATPADADRIRSALESSPKAFR